MLAYRLGPAEVRFTGRAEGDLSANAGAARDARQLAIVDRAWRTAKQVHGARVVVVDEHTASGSIGEADALVTTDPAVALAVRIADCAPVAFAGGGVAAIAHAGWRGLLEGVLANTVATMRELGAPSVEAALGPCVHAECYEFGADDLDAIAERFGASVRSETSTGAPALDVPAAVRAALAAVDVDLVEDASICTACDAGSYWSHRARGEVERQAGVVWLA